jgi:hypothetical protein
MAIGDAFQASLGSGSTTRQPSSGVVEKLTAVIKDSATDRMLVGGTAGSSRGWIAAAVDTDTASAVSTVQMAFDLFNMAVFITNSEACQKNGSTDTIVLCGVQVND